MPDRSRVPAVLGVVVIAAGLIPIGAAFFADDAGFHAPRWIVALIGAMFVLAGLAVMRRPAGAEDAAADLSQSLLGAVIVTAFAVIMAWLLLFTSPDEWQSSGSLPFQWLPGLVQNLLFYALLGTMTLLTTAFAVAAWLRVLRRLTVRLPAPIGAAVPWAGAVLLLGVLVSIGWTLFAEPAGPREPLVRLAFDGTLDDSGPHAARGTARGDEIAFHPGVVGQALHVGGTRDWVDYELPAGLDLSGSVSLELWLRRDDWINPYRGGSGVQTVVVAGHLTFDLDVVWAAEAGRYRLRPRGRVGDITVRARTVDVPAHAWTHVALVYDQPWHAARLYLDGRRVARAGVHLTPPLVRQQMLRIGTWHEANQAFRGEVDELRVYGYALGEDEIRASAARGR